MRWFPVALSLASCAAPAGKPRDVSRDLDVEAPARLTDGGVIAPKIVDVVEAPSVRFVNNSPVRNGPSAATARIGIVGKDTRAKVSETSAPAEGCDKRWLHLEPRGWVCESNVVLDDQPPTTAARVGLDDTSDPELGTYGTVYGTNAWVYDSIADAEANGGHPPDGAMKVRRVGEHVIRGVRYAVLGDGSLVEPNAIAPNTPSGFHGKALANKLDVAWVRRRGRPGDPIEIHTEPKASSRATGMLPARSLVTIAESKDGFARIGDARWVAVADLRIPKLAAQLPAGVGEHDRWFDVDVDDQTLVAYEGMTPVYATLVSTGRTGHRTPAALARVTVKFRTTTMTNSTADEAYSVADVPWTMFYDDTLALHGTYWHDAFGDTHSHGCVNLAPRDARILYDWAGPEVPPGWTAVYASPATGFTGSVVRVHSR